MWQQFILKQNSMEELKLSIVRWPSTKKSTSGIMYIDGKFFCFTLEDVEREVKIMHETCIPKGIYKVVLTMSNRFKKILPLVCDVPNFEGIRIHAGNTDKSTSGCILVGKVKDTDFIGKSMEAKEELMKILTAHKGIITLEIK